MARKIFTRRKRASWLSRITTVLVFLFVFWLFGLLAFLLRLPEPTSVAIAPQADAIVVLTGGEGRIAAGLEALDRGKGQRLLVSGVNQGLDEKTIRQAIGGTEEKFDCCIDLGWKAIDTTTNAEEALSWSREHDFQSILLITTDDHMPRAMIEFERLETNLVIYPLAVEGDGKLPRISLEYSKFLISLIRLLIEN